MKIPRQKMPEREAKVRNRDFSEVNRGLAAAAAILEARRCLDCANPQCVVRLPRRHRHPELRQARRKGRFRRRGPQDQGDQRPAGHLRPRLPPGDPVRGCLQPRKGHRRARRHRQPRAVRLGLRAVWKGEVFIPDIAPPTGHKVAVIGAGPAGLTVAGELAKKGHKVTIFEALHIAGGVLVYGIPEFRLPKAILEAEVDYLKKLGVEFRTSFVVGKTATPRRPEEGGLRGVLHRDRGGLAQLHEDPGREPGRRLFGQRIPDPGQPDAGLRVPRVRYARLSRPDGRPSSAAATWPWTRSGPPSGWARSGPSSSTGGRRTEMPARIEEVKHAEEEGIEFHFLTTPIRYIGDEAGHVKAMECLRMELGRAGRFGAPASRPGRRLRVHDGGRPRRRGRRPKPESAHPPDDAGPQGRQVGQRRSRSGDHGDEPPRSLCGRRYRPGRGHRHPGHGRRPDWRPPRWTNTLKK